jgi:hypothetical protein
VALCTAIDAQYNPQIASDGSGGAIVVWYDRRNGSDYDIYVQRVNSTGVVQWTTDGVALCALAGDQAAPQILADGAGGAIVVWADGRSVAPGVYAQRVSSSGAPLWTNNGVPIGTPVGGAGSPQILSDGTGGALIVWDDGRSGFFGDLYAQRVNGAGAAQWTVNGVAICAAPESQAEHQLVADGGGGAIIVWQDQRNASNDIYAQRVNSAGTVQWTTNGVAISTASGYQTVPRIVSDGSGGAIMAWQDSRSGTNMDIYAQRINGLGVVQWTIDGVAVSTAASSSAPRIASDGSGGAVLLWRDKRKGNFNIYAQRVNGAAALQWPVNGMPIGVAPGDKSVPQIVPDGSGGAITVWNDLRNAWMDIFSQRVGADGLP